MEIIYNKSTTKNGTTNLLLREVFSLSPIFIIRRSSRVSFLLLLSFLLLFLFLFLDAAHPEHVVAPYENFSQIPGFFAVDDFVRVGELQIHVRVRGHQKTSVGHAGPFQFHEDFLPGQRCQERFRVDRYRGRHRRENASSSSVSFWLRFGSRTTKNTLSLLLLLLLLSFLWGEFGPFFLLFIYEDIRRQNFSR